LMPGLIDVHQHLGFNGISLRQRRNARAAHAASRSAGPFSWYHDRPGPG
jgi:imidazolonepropionase-like amidohydrolase